MRNRKEIFSSNIRKCGYLRVSRSLLKALHSGDAEQSQLAKTLLCVQTFAYFSEGQVSIGGGCFVCRPGEWITTYRQLSCLSGLDRRVVKDRLMQLEKLGVLVVEHLMSYKRIILSDYEQSIAAAFKNPSPPPLVAAAEQGAEESIFATANRFYSQQKELKEELV